ncbi:unnamed protein product [Brassica oleracea]
MASLKIPANVPLPEEDSEQLRKAFKGWGTNEGMIISILAHRNAAQRSLIRAVYAANYNKNLLNELDKELSGDFERAVMLWTLEPVERDAYLAKESTKMFIKNNWVLLKSPVLDLLLSFSKPSKHTKLATRPLLRRMLRTTHLEISESYWFLL